MPYARSLSLLSSRLHLVWALRTGGFLESRPTYQHAECFTKFPFPDPIKEVVGIKLDRLGEELDATRKRFSLWDVSQGQVGQVEKTGRPSKGVTLTAPRDGVILARSAIDGSYVEPATQLFLISDVSRLWVVFDIFQANMGHVSLGQEVTLECEGLDEPHKAKVSFLAPVVDPATRSLRARVEVDNRKGHLRPGAFSTVTLEIPVGEGLAVPEDAVIRTGKRDLVFVIVDKMAVPTEVKLGPKVGGFYRIDSGLNEGDIVATGALFLLDAESRLRAASGGMGGNPHGGH